MPSSEVVFHVFKSLWTKTNVFWGVLSFSWIVFCWELYLKYRQYNVYKTVNKVPKELDGLIDDETFRKSRSYSIDNARFDIVTSFFGQIQTTLTIYFYLIAFFWNLSRKIMTTYLGYGPLQSNEIYQSLIFYLIVSIVSQIIDLPLSLYKNFVIEERHGFNKQTLGFYFWDKLKKFGVSFALTTPILSTVIYIVRSSGPYFFFYAWVFISLMSLILIFFATDIMALFDKFSPLPEGDLRMQIETLASSVKFPLSNIYVVEGSKRSSHSNAYFTGMFNKKTIVLYDTLIEDYNSTTTVAETSTVAKSASKSPSKGCTTPEILAILCHELGHWDLSHIFQQLILAEINLFVTFLLFSFCYTDVTLYSAFGFNHDKPVLIGLTLMSMVLSPYSEVFGFLTTKLSRRNEYQADAYSKRHGYAEQLKTALVKLQKENLGFPARDDLYSEFNDSHPTLIQRLAALGKTN